MSYPPSVAADHASAPDEFAVSLIVCSRNGGAKLDLLFSSLRAESFQEARAELLLVANACTDDTLERMQRFAEASGIPTRVLAVERPGLGFAQNQAVSASKGGIIAFTDDDCRLADDYLQVLTREFDPQIHDYGGGLVLRGDEADDARVANSDPRTWFKAPTLIPPRALVVPGTLHGANLFFKRTALEALGGFDEDLGSGCLLDGADAETIGRASLFGFTGIALPSLKVFHHHGRRTGSIEADRTVASYAGGRGAYYASLFILGEERAWRFWPNTYRGRLSRAQMLTLETELRGAADYLRLRREKPARAGLRKSTAS